MSQRTRKIQKAWRMSQGKSMSDQIRIFVALATGKIKLDDEVKKE